MTFISKMSNTKGLLHYENIEFLFFALCLASLLSSDQRF